MRLLNSLLFFLLFSFQIHAQLTGTVTDKSGEPLAFASIYIQGTTIGTTSNIEGKYTFELKKGTYQLVFQYVGFQQKTIAVAIEDQPIVKDVILQEESFSITEIVVRADAEDPAYPIIRKAIEKRKYYKEQVQAYQCNIYIKGAIKLLDAPDKIMGNDIGDMGGSLDTNRQGIVYLSESESVLHFKQPDHYKEIMMSSKVSGNDNGWSFNRFSEMDFNLYHNTALYQRQIISPIASGAMQYYKYKLLGTFTDDEGRLVNKIKVIPKRSEDPVYEGIIYINDELWNIQSTELFLTNETMKQPGLDTMWLRQVHVPVEKPDVWRLLSQTISFKAGVFGFKMKGDFTGVFNDYNINPTYEKGFFNNEALFFEEGANEKTLEYWDSIRPIPLTVEEDKDYVKKDSLQEIWDSKEFKDSVDLKNNKFKVTSLLFGYTYRNSWKRKSFSLTSPLSTIQFNPVQGWLGSINLIYRKGYDDRNLRWFSINPKIQYGFADEQWRAKLKFFYHINRTKFSRLNIEGGREAVQFNPSEPISVLVSEWFNLVYKRNLIRLYDKKYFSAYYSQEIRNGLVGQIETEFAHRSELQNNTDFSFSKKEEAYASNIPINEFGDLVSNFSNPNSFTLEARFRIRFAQKYLTYPDRKYIMGSKYPAFWIKVKRAFAINNDFVGYTKATLQIYDDYIKFGVLGHSQFNLVAGTFLGKKTRPSFIDFHHFNGSETIIGNPNRYSSFFKRLPYYEYSTYGPFVEGHFQHHFDGFLLDKIPLLRKLGWQTVLGIDFLHTQKYTLDGINRDVFAKNYAELAFGVDNIGWGVFRLFRVDVVASFKEWKYDSVGLMLGIKL